MIDAAVVPDTGGLTLALEIGTILRLARLVELVILAMFLEVAYGISSEISSHLVDFLIDFFMDFQSKSKCSRLKKLAVMISL